MHLPRGDERRPNVQGYLSPAVCVVVLFLTPSCRANQAADVTADTLGIPIGDSVVNLVVHRSDRPGLTYLNVHDDENTAVEAAVAVVRTFGGAVYELQHGGERNLTFQLGDSSYTVDPNRIFTPAGIDATLARHGTAHPAAHDAVGLFADSLLQAVGLRDLDAVVTVHNNTDDGYSALSYAEGGAYAEDAELTHLVSDRDPDDFFFVTSHELFASLQATGANVILQDNSSVRDDGSLSVLAGQEGLPYVNVEAQHGHVETQRRMIESLRSIVIEKSTTH